VGAPYAKAEGNTEAKDPGGHCWDGVLREWIRRGQIVPKAVSEKVLRGFQVPVLEGDLL
jgi:hypothetical protein